MKVIKIENIKDSKMKAKKQRIEKPKPRKQLTEKEKYILSVLNMNKK